MNRLAPALFWIGLCLVVVSVWFLFFGVRNNFSRMETRPAGETQAQIDAEDRAIVAGDRREQDFQIGVALLAGGLGVVISLAGGIGYFVFRPAGKSTVKK
jgi:hypothetical protein